MLEPNEARKQLQEIVDKKEYQVYYQESQGWFEKWWEQVKDWVGDLLSKLFPTIQVSNTASGPILITIIGLVVILLAVFSILIFRTVKRNRILKSQKSLQSLIEKNWSFLEHMAEAKKQEQLKEFTLATRHLFLALLLYFKEKEWVEARIWKTNWEYYDELRKINSQFADQFYKTASFFDEVTYGERKVTSLEFTQFRNGIMNWMGEIETISGREEEQS